MIGVLDWELSTIGHPLSDLANLLLPFYMPYAFEGIAGLQGLPELPVPDAKELMQVYCAKFGRPYPINKWDFCIAFALFRVSQMA